MPKYKGTTKSEDDSPPQPRIKELPKTISELYLSNRMEMQRCVEEFQYYRRLLESIELGSGMLKEHPELKARTAKVLVSDISHPGLRDMKFLSKPGLYSCSIGEGSTGKITVRPEELEVGETSLRNQQCNSLIRPLLGLDNEIYSALIEEGILRTLTISQSVEMDIMKRFKKELDG